MASYQLVVVVVVLAVLAATINSTPVAHSDVKPTLVKSLAGNLSHNLIVGSRIYGDKLVYSENISESFSTWGKRVVEKNIPAPPNMYITQVKCLDQMTDGTGAYPIITSGGPPLTYVSIQLTSQMWRGVYFNVEVYALRQ